MRTNIVEKGAGKPAAKKMRACAYSRSSCCFCVSFPLIQGPREEELWRMAFSQKGVEELSDWLRSEGFNEDTVNVFRGE